MHNVQPHQECKILTIQLALKDTGNDAEMTDAIRVLMTEVGQMDMPGIILDWRYSDDPRDGVKDPDSLMVLPGSKSAPTGSANSFRRVVYELEVAVPARIPGGSLYDEFHKLIAPAIKDWQKSLILDWQFAPDPRDNASYDPDLAPVAVAGADIEEGEIFLLNRDFKLVRRK